MTTVRIANSANYTICRLQWAKCCLDLFKDEGSADEVSARLNDLPKDLDDHYSRVLSGIPECYAHIARRAFWWMACSKRPLYLEEVAAAATFTLDPLPQSVEVELSSPYDIIDICAKLVTTSPDIEAEPEHSRLRFNHSSIMNHLFSDAIRSSRAAFFALDEVRSQQLILDVLVSCLLSSLRHSPIVPKLLPYAKEYWYDHYLAVASNGSLSKATSAQLVQFLDTRVRDIISKGINTSHLQNLEGPDAIHDDNLGFPSSLYYASLLGMFEIVEMLIARGEELNDIGGYLGTALQAAAYNGHPRMVNSLIHHCAEVNSISGHYGDALQAACCSNNFIPVGLLLAAGANPSNGCGVHGSALQATAIDGREQIVHILLEYQADVDIRGGLFGTPLIAAAQGGHEEVARMIFGNGANVNAFGTEAYPTALYAASIGGHLDMVSFLLSKRANPNIRHGSSDTALKAAARGGRADIARLLRAHWAALPDNEDDREMVMKLIRDSDSLVPTLSVG